jgi:hypothetical protein
MFALVPARPPPLPMSPVSRLAKTPHPHPLSLHWDSDGEATARPVHGGAKRRLRDRAAALERGKHSRAMRRSRWQWRSVPVHVWASSAWGWWATLCRSGRVAQSSARCLAVDRARFGDMHRCSIWRWTSYGCRMDSDRIRTNTNSDVTIYHILFRIRIRILSNTNTKRIFRIRIRILTWFIAES